jgi:hypothetical protein
VDLMADLGGCWNKVPCKAVELETGTSISSARAGIKYLVRLWNWKLALPYLVHVFL